MKKEESFIIGEDSRTSTQRNIKTQNKKLEISKNINISINNCSDIIARAENINISSCKKLNESESKISELKSNLHKKNSKEQISTELQKVKINPKKKPHREKEYNISKLSIKQSYCAEGKNEQDFNGNFQYKEFLLDLENQDKNNKIIIGNTSNNLIDTRIIFESDGYIEESEDLREKLNTEMLSDNFTVTSKTERVNNNLLIENDKITINNEEELREVLFGKTKYKDFYCSLQLVERELNENEKISIIKEKELLVLLAYLFKDLHPGLIELGDNFIEERRKYFRVDNDTYNNIINYFLRKKEEFFLCVLSDLMSKLNISQRVLDNTFFYYMNIADSNLKEVTLIRSAYDKVYHAGLKL